MAHLLSELEQLEMLMDLNLDESDPGLGGVELQTKGTFSCHHRDDTVLVEWAVRLLSLCHAARLYTDGECH